MSAATPLKTADPATMVNPDGNTVLRSSSSLSRPLAAPVPFSWPEG